MRTLILAALACAALAGCQRTAGANAGQPPPARGPVAMAKGLVDVEGGLIRVGAARDGAINAVLVHEGDAVSAGQVLATLDDRQSVLAVAVARTEEDERRTQVGLAGARLDIARHEAERALRLAEADAGPRQDADQAAGGVRVAAAEQQQAARALASAAARTRLDSFEIEARRIRSPVAGRLIRVAASPGALAAASNPAPLFVIAPAGARIVRADLDEAFADQVRAGMRATVVSELDERRSYPAEVVRVADAFSAPTLVDDLTARADTRVLSVTLRLDDAAALRIGARVLVSFHQ